jgi:hypothetical protein
MIPYHNMVDPTELSPADMPESAHGQDVLNHYAGVLNEFTKHEFHVCSLCRPAQVRNFFRLMDTCTDGNAQELQELEFRLAITPQEWNANQQRLDREEQERYNAHPFIKSVLGDREIMEAL